MAKEATTHIRIRFQAREPLDILEPPGSLYRLSELLSKTYRVPADRLEIKIDDERAVATILTDDKAYRAAKGKYAISGVLYLAVRVLDAPLRPTNAPLSPQQATLVQLQDSIEQVHDRYLAEVSSMDQEIRAVYEQALQGDDIPKLQLNGYILDLYTARQLADPLQLVSSLVTLDLSGCRVTPDIVTILSSAIKGQEGLEQVYFSNNDIGEEGASNLLSIVGALPKLVVLAMEDNRLGPQGALHLSRVLLNSPQLVRLSLQHNILGAEGIRHIVGIFTSCPNLTYLSIGNNLLREDGARILATSLPLLPGLKQLFVDRNEFGPAGLAELCPVLSHMDKTLEVLDLSFNRPTEAGASHILSLASRLKLDTLVLEAECPKFDLIRATLRAGGYLRPA